MLRRVLTRATLGLALLSGASAASQQQRQPVAAHGVCNCAMRRCAYDDAIRAAVTQVSAVWPLPSSFIKAVIQRESNFQPAAVSSAGAIGLMQVLPSNAERLGFRKEDLWTPGKNILAGTRLLAALLRHYRGDVISTLVAYNARPRPLEAAVPENGETPAYVRAVLATWAAFQACGTAEAGAGSPQRPAPSAEAFLR
jgi:soluble lytic murein transglycosylase-like protein